ncbi:MAG: MarR family transcriptional regulator [Spirochaetes bacterium]|jgi:DNA-binding transcriptional regulator GbsR (MarR family)|nr:MarR family transcriptional regulator [Spirochaetota bacterium]
MAQFFEQLGASATLGRLFGLLLVSREPLALETLAERLGLSKPAVSVQIRQLEGLRYCHRLPRGSDRKQYFALNPDYLAENLRIRMDAQDRWLAQLERTLASNKDDQPEVLPERMGELIRFQRMMQECYQKLIDQFKGDTQ